ncbi:hypothetical protein GYMLUDRAFT_523222 [Collybiopsis luxurians FD-317 M1]|nr:hypothetical protein GYMLUDRAFT_523222 [Collybiopsis luxurians FD-317 M1]
MHPRKRMRHVGQVDVRSSLGTSSQPSSLFDQGFLYSTKLRAHTSCINALAFSSKGGRFLASGGDDLRIHLWDFHQEDVVVPSDTLIGPRNNIFCLEFSCSNQYLFAGGTDDTVHKYDISWPESSPHARTEHLPNAMFREDDTIRDISCHPYQDEVFLSASDGGRIIQHDARMASGASPITRAADTIQLLAEVTSVKFHPTTEHLFLTSDSKSNVCLRDTRMAFGPRKTRTNDGIVRTFCTAIAKRNTQGMSIPEPSSKRLAVTFLHYYPTIYSLSDPYPIAICTGANTAESATGRRGYSNSCTMKHGCFGGSESDEVEYYCGGSDNFCGYLWKIPSVESLTERREEIPAQEWRLANKDTIGFTEGIESSKFVPAEISAPAAVLKGHNSIVNTALIHPHLPLILTAGIERSITLHSPFSSSPFSRRLSLTPQEVRQLPSSADPEEARVIDSLLLGLDPTDRDDPDVAEVDTIRLFDRILRMEGEADPFEARPWRQPDSSDNESESESESEDS